MKINESMKELKNLYPLTLVNTTNRFSLKCQYCFLFREGNPNKGCVNDWYKIK